MKKLKENKGFTLVELIVVIAILGILAAVAVPTYSGYIKKANNAKVMSELTTIVTAAQSAAVQEQAGNVTGIQIAKSNGTVTVKVSESGKTVTGAQVGEFAANVDSDGKVDNWTQVIKGSDYESKSYLVWKPASSSADAGWEATDTALS